MSTTKQGLVLFGKLLGHRSRSGQKNGKTWTMHEIGIEVPRYNGFPGESVVHQVSITDEMVNQGILDTIVKLQNKQVCCQVYIRVYNGQNGAGYNLALESGTTVTQVG